jgi:hypothetical protein
MTFASDLDTSAPPTLAKPPGWIAVQRGVSLEDMGFAAGAALSHLSGLLALQTTPVALLRARLALLSAEASVKRAGRPERQMDLRDAVHFLRPKDLPGPAGEIYLSWRGASDTPVTIKTLQRTLPEIPAEDLADCLDVDSDRDARSPIARASATLKAVCRARPGDEIAALILAEAALTRALKWRHLVPLLSTSLSSKDLRKSGEDLHLACYRAVIHGALQASALASDLTRRAAALDAVVPKLRSKRARQVVALFLTRDVLAPGELSHLMSDRAARRICDRLVDLGGVREVTGRETFRLYGV